MAKITLVLCDVRPCTRIAEREFEVDGKKFYVCGENCFVKFWSRAYENWNSTDQQFVATCKPNSAQQKKHGKEEILESLRSELHMLKV
jgi:hypothetical protein